MKKKIILICSLVVFCLCVFTISASASNYYDFSDIDLSGVYSVTPYIYSTASDEEQYSFDSTLGYDLSFISFDYYSNVTYYTWGLLNCENWHKYIVSHNITSADELRISVDNGVSLGYWSDSFSIYNYIGGSAYAVNDIWNAYQGWLAEQNAPTYDDGYTQGKIDGVTEFKTTDEYKSQYTTGYTNGIAEFKASDVYAETLLLERQTGQAEGVNTYLASEEYANALQAEYDNGYNTATTEQEQKQMKNNLGVILGTCGIVIVGLLFVYFIISRKKHKRR